MSAGTPWYEEAFQSGYLAVYAHRDLDAARREVAGLVARGIGGRTLDLGCGFGRHTLALLESGVDALGMDRSAELLLRSRELAGGERLAGRLVRGDFRRLPFAAAAFDSIVMLFSSFGYFDDETNARVLGELARILHPGGGAVLDLMNPDLVRASLVPESRREGKGWLLEERRRLCEGGRRVRKDVLLRGADGSERRWHEDVRLFDNAELAPLLESRGLALDRTEGDFDGRPFQGDSPRQIVWARRCRRAHS